MIEIKLEEASSLTLEMAIEGDVKTDAPEMHFTVMSEGLRYSFPATRHENGVYKVNVPQMLGKINEGEYDAIVEIIVDGKYFKPLTETVKFTKEVKPIVKMNEHVPTLAREAAVSVKMGKVALQPKLVEATRITNVKDMVEQLVETQGSSHSIDTTQALRCLASLVSNTKLTESAGLLVDPARAASEAEVLAMLKMVRRHGTDIQTAGNIGPLMNISERVTQEMRELLLDKGLPARELQRYL